VPENKPRRVLGIGEVLADLPALAPRFGFHPPKAMPVKKDLGKKAGR